MVEPKNGSTILKPQNVKAVTTKFDIAKPQKRDSDNHINGKALTINFDRHPKFIKEMELKNWLIYRSLFRRIKTRGSIAQVNHNIFNLSIVI